MKRKGFGWLITAVVIQCVIAASFLGAPVWLFFRFKGPTELLLSVILFAFGLLIAFASWRLAKRQRSGWRHAWWVTGFFVLSGVGLFLQTGQFFGFGAAALHILCLLAGRKAIGPDVAAIPADTFD